MDFAALPPEINSARMYAGPGSGPMLAAAATWDGLADELYTAATSYSSVVSGLTSGPWLGPSSAAMAAAAVPYVAWLTTTAGQALQTANQARAAALAYQSAFAMTVPPPVIAANRSLLMTLIATNVLGQNTPAIAANLCRLRCDRFAIGPVHRADPDHRPSRAGPTASCGRSGRGHSGGDWRPVGDAVRDQRHDQ